MNKGLRNILAVAAVVLVIAIAAYNFFIGNYNQIVELDEGVNTSWAQVQTQYQRRLDLIPNLVATVQGYAKHEQETFIAVTQARAAAESATQAAAPATAEEMEKIQSAQNALTAGVHSILAVAENYPELHANENFLALQDQLEGTENRIAVARQDYNSTVQKYNVFIRKFPQSIIANQNGFEKKQQFAASAEAAAAPTVSF